MNQIVFIGYFPYFVEPVSVKESISVLVSYTVRAHRNVVDLCEQSTVKRKLWIINPAPPTDYGLDGRYIVYEPLRTVVTVWYIYKFLLYELLRFSEYYNISFRHEQSTVVMTF